MINKIINMDVLEGMKKIDDSSIDLIVTDPPYLIDYKTNRRKDKNHKFIMASNTSKTETIELNIPNVTKKSLKPLEVFVSPL